MSNINDEIIEQIQNFLSGKIGVIEISRNLGSNWDIVARYNPELANLLTTFTGIDF